MTDRAEILLQIAASAAESRDLRHLLTLARPLMSELHPLDRLAIAHTDAGRARVHYVAAEGSVAEGIESDLYKGSHLAWVLENRRPLIQRDAQRPIVPYDERARSRGIASYVVVPVVAAGDVVSTLSVASQEPDSPWCGEVEFLQLVAGQLAGTIAADLRFLAATEANRHKDEVLAVLAHEMRSPLTTIVGFAGLISGPEPLPDSIRAEAMEVIGRSARRLSFLIDDLTAASAVEKGTLRIDVADVDLADIARKAASEFPDLEFVDRAAPAPVKADADRLLQVVVNLLANVRRYGKPPVELTTTVEGDHSLMSVADAGPGFRPEIAERLFQKYATLGSSRGTGIGLWLVRQIVEVHGGTVSAGNRAEGGAEIRIELPAAR